MNMVGLDVLDLFRKAADGKISNIEEYFKTIPEAFRLRVRSSGTPDMMRRYPGQWKVYFERLLHGILHFHGTGCQSESFQFLMLKPLARCKS